MVAPPFYTLVDRTESTSDSGVMKWEYRGRYQECPEWNWSSKADARDSCFAPLRLHLLHALINLYAPRRAEATNTLAEASRPLLGTEVFSLFPIGTPIVKPSQDRKRGGNSAITPAVAGKWYHTRTMSRRTSGKEGWNFRREEKAAKKKITGG